MSQFRAALDKVDLFGGFLENIEPVLKSRDSIDLVEQDLGSPQNLAYAWITARISVLSYIEQNNLYSIRSLEHSEHELLCFYSKEHKRAENIFSRLESVYGIDITPFYADHSSLSKYEDAHQQAVETLEEFMDEHALEYLEDKDE